jgi:putative hemolysin
MEQSLFLVVLTLVLSCLFSASETALTSLGKLEIQSIIAQGGWRAHILQNWIRDPGRILITILVGNNIANTIATSVFTLWANNHLSGNWIPVGISVFALLMILVSEIFPKLVARQSAISLAPFSMRYLQVVNFILFPATWVINRVSKGFVRLSGRTGRDPRSVVSEEDVTNTIEMATKEGGLDRETGEVLSNLIEFPDMRAKDVMTPRSRIQGLSISWTMEECLRFIASDGHSRYPVMRGSLDEIVGVLLVKDILAHMQKGNQGSWTRVIRRPYFVSEMGHLGTILRDMKRWGTHLALARNETGVLTGLLTLEDLIEEIVGEIRDEHDDPVEAGGDRAMGGPQIVNGDIPIIDFNERFQSSLPMDVSYSTLNGYLLSKTGGEVPPIGTLVVDEGSTFRIHSVSESGVVTVQVIPQLKRQD